MDDRRELRRFTLRVPQSGAELAVAELWELAPEGFEEHELSISPDVRNATAFVLYAPSEDAGALAAGLEALAERLREATGCEVSVSAETIQDQNWREAWKVHFTLQRIPPFVIRPSWIDYAPAPGERVIHLDPGSAFGTGLHETTRLCLKAIASHAEAGASPRLVLDFGTGSGILGIAACRLFPCRVVAVDDDPLALSACDENASRNDVRERFSLRGSLSATVPLAELTLANVSRPVLVEMAGALVAATTPGGSLVLSGLLLSDEAAVIEAFVQAGAVPQARSSENDWLALELTRTSPARSGG